MNLRLTLLLAAFALLASVYSLVTPLFEGPDEIWHFAFADHLAQGRGLPVLQASGEDIWLRNAAHPPLYHLLVAAAIAPFDRSDFPAAYRFNLASPRITPGGNSQTPNLLIHTAHEDYPFQQSALAAHVGRLVSVLLSTLAVYGVWHAARLLLPSEPELPLWATAFVAFIPQFVYQAGLINNDALAIAAGTWLIVALLQLMRAPSYRWAALSGLLLGLTLLAKIGLLILLPLPALALAFAYWNTRQQNLQLQRWIKLAFTLYLIALLIAGWWYVRNLLLYGDPLAWQQWQALAGAKRAPPTPGDLFNDALGFFGMFWVDLTLRADGAWAWLFWALTAVVLGGLIQRWRARVWPAVYWPGVLVTLSSFVLLLAAAAAYAFSITEIHGRLVYPALPFVGVTLALGLSGWGQRAGQWVLRSASSLLLSFSLLAPPLLIAPAYARPVVSTLPAQVAVNSVGFGSLLLLGHQPLTSAVQPGQTLVVNTYWHPLSIDPAMTYYQALVLIQAGDGQVVGHAEHAIGSDLYPSNVWQPAEIVLSKLQVPIAATVSAPTLVMVQLNVRTQASLTPLFPSPHILGRVRITTTAPCTYATAADLVFGEQIRLLGYTLTPTELQLCWQALQPIPADYTVFVHQFDAQGQPQGNADSPPRQGRYPTSVWQPGEQIPDSHPLNAMTTGYITFGLYRLDTGERLPFNAAGETEVRVEWNNP